MGCWNTRPPPHSIPPPSGPFAHSPPPARAEVYIFSAMSRHVHGIPLLKLPFFAPPSPHPEQSRCPFLYIFLANVIFIEFVGVSLNPWSVSLATEDWPSDSNSTNAIPTLPGTIRTSDRPGNCLKSA